MMHVIVKQNGGFTLPETIVTIAIMGILFMGVAAIGYKTVGNMEDREFEAECNTILEWTLRTRDQAMMFGEGNGTSSTYNQTYVYFYHFENGIQKTKSIKMAHSKIMTSKAIKVTFSPSGTISTGNTITIKSLATGKIKKLVFQVASGRIYLTDG